jgi:GntR family transcriptional repressor for pyruvate dehydrogenase complex
MVDLAPVARRSLSDAVFEQLRDHILSGALGAGATLPGERALAASLGVNRSALREGLKRLEQARLVTVRHGGATQVLDFRATGGMELLGLLLFGPDGGLELGVARAIVELRSALAPDVARRAAERRSAAQLEALEARVASMRAAEGDVPRLQRDALSLWDTLVDASGNIAYRLAFNGMTAVYTQLLELLAPVLAAELRDVEAYAALVAAVAAARPELAERRARRLIQRGEASLGALLTQAEVLRPSGPAVGAAEPDPPERADPPERPAPRRKRARGLGTEPPSPPRPKRPERPTTGRTHRGSR